MKTSMNRGRFVAFTILTLSLLAGLEAQARDPAPTNTVFTRKPLFESKPKAPPKCASDKHVSLAPHDYFDEAIIFPGGAFKGCQADTSSERSIKALDDSQMRRILGSREYANLKGGTRVFANFRAAAFDNAKSRYKKINPSGFWVAALDPTEVEKIIVQTEVFQSLPDIPAAHTQLRLKMFDGKCVQLYSQDRRYLGQKGPCVENFLYSIEAMNTLGADVTFDLVKGLKGYFMLAYKMIRLGDKAAYMVDEAKHPVVQIELKLEGTEVERLVDAFVSQGTNPDRTEIYDTLRASCTTELYRVFDKIVVSERAPIRNIIAGNFMRLPIFPESYLGLRGLVGQKLKNLEEEIGRSRRDLLRIP